MDDREIYRKLDFIWNELTSVMEALDRNGQENHATRIAGARLQIAHVKGKTFDGIVSDVVNKAAVNGE